MSLLVVSTLVLLMSSLVVSTEYTWSLDPTAGAQYPVDGSRLNGHVIATFANAYIVTQCSRRCLTTSGCLSYNFLSSTQMCELNSASHVTNPSDVQTTSGVQYYTRNAWSLDKQALGPCADSPCLNKGTCLTLLPGGGSATNGQLTSSCLCTPAWTGSTCNVPAPVYVWTDWSAWSTCSVSCSDGYATRRRTCINSQSGGSNAASSNQLCSGQDQETMHCYLQQCPLFSRWTAFGICSTAGGCGQGVQMGSRVCANGGKVGVDPFCVGPTNETTPCMTTSCDAPVRLSSGPTYGEGRVDVYDDVTAQWLPVCTAGWTKQDADVVCRQMGFKSGSYGVGSYASMTGASGAMTQVRCSGSETNLARCPHNAWNDNTCSTGPHAGVQCIVDGRWSAFSDWGGCSVSCGSSGVSVRTRQCNSPPALRGGMDCTVSGNGTESRPCNLTNCPVEGIWGNWTAYGQCNVTCGGGRQYSSRVCTPPLYSGAPCSGDTLQERECNTQPCPIDGVWGNWTAYGQCNASCGGGTQTRSRQCTPPLYNGVTCTGDSTQWQQCNTQTCAIDGVWQSWGPYGSCNATCGGGIKMQSRLCTGPFFGGKPCDGPTVQLAFCSDTPCPVNGQWSLWTRWMDCPVSCGAGTQNRYRTCSDVLNGGNVCPGDANQFQPCNNGPCPVNCTWNAFSDWSACNVTCGGGVRARSRTSNPALNGGDPCDGEPMDQMACNTKPCPIDCVWQNWTSWSTCNVTCGGGMSARSRTSSPAQYGGAVCVGDTMQTTICSTNICPQPGIWGPWSDWSGCSATCATGIRFHTRMCNMTSMGVNLTLPCLPLNANNETKPCNTNGCSPVAASCSELYTRGLEDNTYVTIDVDGSTGALAPFTVFCQKNVSGILTIVHNLFENGVNISTLPISQSLKTAQVSYVDNIGKVISLNQLVALVTSVTSCQQYIGFRCSKAPFNSATVNSATKTKCLTYWGNRFSEVMYYWGGANPVATGMTNSMMCACGQTGTCAGGPKNSCGCDVNDATWRLDDGLLTNMDDLPVSSFTTADTGALGEQGVFVLGALTCTA